MLTKLHINKEPSKKYLDHLLWGIGTKISHFKQIQKLTGVDFKDMVFFDDESRNKDVEKALGVTFVLVRNGVTWDMFNKGIQMWRTKNGH